MRPQNKVLCNTNTKALRLDAMTPEIRKGLDPQGWPDYRRK